VPGFPDGLLYHARLDQFLLYQVEREQTRNRRLEAAPEFQYPNSVQPLTIQEYLKDMQPHNMVNVFNALPERYSSEYEANERAYPPHEDEEDDWRVSKLMKYN
jgi:hypothetical protein